MNVLDDLNSAQREAAARVEGPLLIFAGAGTGKTRVITHRIANLIYNVGIPAENILAVTFTNKAAQEMRDRLAALAQGAADPESAKRVFFSTFHRFCAWLLRNHGEVVGVKRHFTIFDQADSIHLVRQILKSMNIESTLYRPAVIASIIDKAKNEMKGPAELDASDNPVSEKAAKIFVEYERRLKESNALDFTDLLVYTVRAMRASPPLLKHLQERFTYILVDEYQDTNRVQYDILRMLAAHQNLCVVGDDDQSIYSWRGADIRNILSFEKDYPTAHVVKLEQNYRSTQGILDMAYRIIQNNRDRADKKLFTSRGTGEAPLVYAAADGYDEAGFVARTIQDMSAQYSYSGMAVFFRMAAQSRLVEEELLARAIPYVVVSGVGFYERREVKDLLAYLRILSNPSDDAAFARILNVPKRGIGDSTAIALADAAKAAGVSRTDLLLNRLDQVRMSAAVKNRLVELAELLKTLSEGAQTMSVEALLRRIVSVTAYFDFLEKSDPAGFEERAANVQELYTVAQEFARRHAHTQTGLVEFVEEMSLITDIDRLDSNADRVSLMTLHAAKGLEFSAAFLIGMEEGSLPHASAFDSNSELEEERRLCYVGITRAKDRLFLSHAFSRRIYGETFDDVRPSRFLEEAGLQDAVLSVAEPPATTSWPRSARSRRKFPSRSPTADGRGVQPRRQSPVSSDHIDRIPLDEETASFGVVPGDRIVHPHFGEGLLLRISGRAEAATAIVRFDRIGQKRLKLAHAKLSKA